MSKLISILLFLLITSCSGRSKSEQHTAKEGNMIKEAKLFTVTQHDGYRVLEVINPWEPDQLLRRYLLVNKEDVMPDSLPEGVIVRTPVERIIAYTAIDIGSLTALGGHQSVVGVCESKYIQSDYIREGLKNGAVKDLGSYTKPNIEQLLSSGADLIIASPYSGRDYGLVEKVGIPIAECASYMERTPLGRCEWIKFYAHFLNKQLLADTIYNDICEKYNSTVQLIAERATSHPTILPEKRYGQVWYVASGDSYAAKLYEAAGATYPWRDVKTDATIPLSFEAVFTKAHDVDVWIFGYCKPDGDLTLSELKSEYSSYAEFKAFKNKTIYVCNTERVPLYEESPLRPDLLLLDIAKMLHPTLFEEHKFVYYKRLEE